jgi:hypothetical protein
MWLSFRSFKPIFYIASSIAVGCLGALSVSTLLFGQIHLLTLVFGASLVGIAQDYGIYFLCARLAAPATLDSPRLLRQLLPALLLMLLAACRRWAWPPRPSGSAADGGLLGAGAGVCLDHRGLLVPSTGKRRQPAHDWHGPALRRRHHALAGPAGGHAWHLVLPAAVAVWVGRHRPDPPAGQRRPARLQRARRPCWKTRSESAAWRHSRPCSSTWCAASPPKRSCRRKKH